RQLVLGLEHVPPFGGQAVLLTFAHNPTSSRSLRTAARLASRAESDNGGTKRAGEGSTGRGRSQRCQCCASALGVRMTLPIRRRYCADRRRISCASSVE